VDGDRRLVRVELTERGRSELREGIQAQVARERLWFDALSAEERTQLTELLARLADQPGPSPAD
jgi:DNA-binding MarR family transcriptional regulator